MKMILALCAAACVVGCAPATMQGLRNKPAISYTFTAPVSYEAAYRVVYTKTQECWLMNGFISGVSPQGVIFPDTGSAHVSMIGHGGTPADTYALIDISAKGANESLISVYTAFKTSWWKARAHQPVAWFQNDSNGCGNV